MRSKIQVKTLIALINYSCIKNSLATIVLGELTSGWEWGWMFHSAGVELGGRELDLGGGGAVFRGQEFFILKTYKLWRRSRWNR